jgi:hypothetical protein
MLIPVCKYTGVFVQQALQFILFIAVQQLYKFWGNVVINYLKGHRHQPRHSK